MLEMKVELLEEIDDRVGTVVKDDDPDVVRETKARAGET